MATKFEGLDRVKRKFERMPANVQKAIAPALRQGAEEIVAMQKRLVAVDKGDIRDSIVIDAKHPLSLTITAKSPEAHLLEFGTNPHPQGGIFAGTQHPGTAAQPFFFPAWRSLRRRVKARASRAMRKAVRES